MITILAIVLPVFTVIAAGYAAARLKAFPDAAIDGLTLFVIRFATPALLFSAMYELSLETAFDPLMIVSFYAGAIGCFFIALVAARALGRRPGESVAIAFGAYFSNTVLLGLPIMMRAYGEAATEPMYAIIALHAPALYSFGMIAMEISRQDGAGAWAAAKRASTSIATNALMLGIVAGLALNLIGLRLPTPVEEGVGLLASATLPAALFALGAGLTRYAIERDVGWALAVSALSLFVHPGLVWLLTDQVFGLDEGFVRAAVVTAAMPAGFNVYVFATMYKRAEGVAAGAVLLSTAFSIVSISAWLALLGGAG